MSHRVCPWWVDYLLASSVRRLLHDPAGILAHHVCDGMTARARPRHGLLHAGAGAAGRADAGHFFAEVRSKLAPGATVLVAEPAGHVKARDFEESMGAATRAGLLHRSGPAIGRSLTALLRAA